MVIKTLLIFSVFFSVFGCSSYPNKYDSKYIITYGVSVTKSTSRHTAFVKCDSFKMVTPYECIFWDGGFSGNILSNEQILISNSTYY